MRELTKVQQVLFLRKSCESCAKASLIKTFFFLFKCSRLQVNDQAYDDLRVKHYSSGKHSAFEKALLNGKKALC